ncbi:DUF748 domain-containing protein [Zobellia uliginosa]|uniref:DUF748 domain-containing protein n=1 Tax=Zobellia uliginosa TaxID=143224 RepID=UPI001C065E56|nr:DUF748 domain-containing protein [Zobellia uliginosa]MBU2946636.1 DUF748 domain-containing protein [Zobellia uliginosa]
MKGKNKRGFKKKRYIIPISIIALLIALRLLMPVLVKKYVNDVLADIPGYYGHVDDIDIALYRGAYVIDNLELSKVEAGSKVPFLDFKQTDISIEWNALLNGKIVSELEMHQPKIIYVFEDQQSGGTEPEVEDWTKALTDLVPIEINNLTITDGTVAFVQLQADPNIDLNLHNINLTATNLRNVVQKKRTLPSQLNATATSIGKGKMVMDGKMNLVKEVPDMDIAFSITDADVKALNDFTKYYAEIDFDSGLFEIYGELAIADGYLKGSMKPIIKNSKLVGKEDGFIETLWEGFVGFFKFVLKNQKNDTLATKIPIEGDLNNVGTKIWPTITNIFKNAWIQAFKGVVDNDISFEDAEKAADNEQTKEERKQDRKDERQNRREAKKQERQKDN